MKMIIMAGGSGTRLWPLSTPYLPKQFIKLIGTDKTIFQSTIERCLLIGSAEDIFIVTGKDYIDPIISQTQQMGISIPKDQILTEPQAKNTLPAIMYAVKSIKKQGDDICAVFASDHIIGEPQKFADTILEAQELARQGVVCFGIVPDCPETGYGYIKPRGNVIDEFKEKPDSETAERYVQSGYLWNSGIFMFHTAQFVDFVKEYNPDVFKAFDNDSIEECFAKTPSISIDYGLLERLPHSYVMPLDVKWNDLGSFKAFYDKYRDDADAGGNISFGDEVILDGKNNLVYSETKKTIALAGVSDIVVVETKDALLICHRDKTQCVKDVVDILKDKDKM